MQAMYCPSIREQKAFYRQKLEYLIEHTPHLIPSRMDTSKMLEHVRGFADYLLMPLSPENVSHNNAMQVEFAG